MSRKLHPGGEALRVVKDAGTHAPDPGSWLGDPGVPAERWLLEAVVEVEDEERGPLPCP